MQYFCKVRKIIQIENPLFACYARLGMGNKDFPRRYTDQQVCKKAGLGL
jgi:hypothetical protein